MHILPVYAALLGLVFVALSVRTIRLRRRLQIAIGAEHPEMLRAVRAHANFAEYTPLVLLLVLMVELQGGAGWLVHALGLALLIGRCVHAWGISHVKEQFVFRITGMVLTFSTVAVSAGWLLVHAALS